MRRPRLIYNARGPALPLNILRRVEKEYDTHGGNGKGYSKGEKRGLAQASGTYKTGDLSHRWFSVWFIARKRKGHFASGAIFEMAGPGSPRRGQSRGDVHDLCRPGKGCKRRVKRYKEERMAPTRYANANAADTGWVVLFRSTYSPFSPFLGPHLRRRMSIRIRLILSIEESE